MAGSDVDAVKGSVRLSDVVEAYGVKLRPSVRCGKSGVCPLHHDTDPSFTVYDDGHYYCYGCHAGGDAISFIQAVESVDFKRAVEILVESFGATNTGSEEYRQIRAKQKLVYDWYASQVAALEELVHGYALLCRECELNGDEEGYFGVASELVRLEGYDEYGGLLGEVRELGGQGDVLVALYDAYGAKAMLPPIQQAKATLAYSQLAVEAYLREQAEVLEWRRNQAVLFLTDYRSADIVPAVEGQKVLQQVIANERKARKVIDGVRDNRARRASGKTGDPGQYPSRRGSGRGNHSQSAA